MKNDLKKRKQIRLPDHDYSEGASYFITICTANRKNIFWTEELDGALTAAGMTAEQEIVDLPERFGSLILEKYVVMPDHVHFLLTLSYPTKEAREKGSSIQSIVGS